ncbi:TPA: hypothetical protein ACG3KH_004337, partial [Clostridioides difficile]
MGITYQSDVEGIKHDQVAEGFFQGWPNAPSPGLGDLYMIDLLCDEELQKFYERTGMRKASGMMIRHYANQAGKG